MKIVAPSVNYKWLIRIKLLVVLSSVLVLAASAICDPQDEPIDPREEYHAIMDQIGFAHLNATVHEGLRNIMDKTIEDNP